jgi:sucrose-phosphate synthase
MEILISKNRLQDKVCLIRHLEYKTEGGEIYRIAYDSKGVFVNPALHEPFGITILEAGATGLPVVATNNGGPVEILQKCKCGVLVDPRDTKTIAEECRKILLDAELWEEYSNNGAARVKQFYTWEAMAKKELALFEEVVDRSF